jgi:uncharacterized membrane protein
MSQLAAATAASRVAFALVMIGLGLIGFYYGDFALVWQRIPVAELPGRQYFAYCCAAIELLSGIGLLLPATRRWASAVLSVFLLLWLILLKLPAVLAMPLMEATWLGLGEIAILFAGGWILLAAACNPARPGWKWLAGPRGIGLSRLLFALSLPMIGLSHFVYGKETAAFVPAWLPYPLAWAYLTGAASLVASAALLFRVVPRLAATLEAAMLGVITLLVWGAGVIAAPTDRTQWTGLLISAAIAIGAWLVADSYRGETPAPAHAVATKAMAS